MIQVQKKERETSENLIKRFTRRVQQSGTLMEVRRSRFRKGEKTKTERRDEALYKNKIRKEIGKLKKMGRFDDETLRELKKKIKQNQQ